ncbi:MAG: phosphopantothenate/pantothenate synthetase [Promethearchaeota archaeon]
MDEEEVSPDHPRATSLRIRAKLTHGFKIGITSAFGLFAHGRGEAFDYLIGEETTENATRAIRAAAASFLLARHSVLSVNGNVAALVPQELVELSTITASKLEVNLYHRGGAREEAIADVLRKAGAKEILGIGKAASATIPEICSDRRRVDPKGILIADTVFVPLEDGDRTEALVKLGKTVITVDLNPLSRTAQMSTITIVDNVVRAMPLLVKAVKLLENEPEQTLQKIVRTFNNRQNLREAIELINTRLIRLAEQQSDTDEGGD